MAGPGSPAGARPLEDPARLSVLARTELMDSGPEEAFDRLTRLAARLLGTPLAFLTLLDDRRQYFKSRFGLPEDAQPLPAAQSYCQHVVDAAEPLIVEDLRTDDRISDPSGLLAQGLMAYCGVPLTDSQGHTLGTLCTIDEIPRRWSPEDVELLRELAAGAIAEIELRMANRELRATHRQQSHLAAIVQTADEAIGTVDVQGRVTAWNRACERIYGWRAAEVLGRPLPAVEIAGSQLEPGLSLAARALAGESVSVHAAPRRRKDGTIVYLDISLTPLRGDDDEIIGVTEIGRDVTEQRRLRAELEGSEQRFRRMFDDAPSGITLVAPDRTLIRANRAFLETVGYTEHELAGRTLEHITHPEDRASDSDGGRMMASGEIDRYEIEKRYIHRSGRTVLVRLSAAPICDEDGAAQYFIVHTEDITERVLREREARMLATMVQHSSDAIEAKDRDGVVTEWSGAAERLYGYTREEAVGRPIGELILPPGCAREEAEAMARALAGESSQADTVRRHKNGELVHVSIAQSPIYDAAGQVVGVAVIARDIAERIRHEQARRAIAEQLRVTVEHAPIGVALIDLADGPDGRLLGVNAAFSRLLSDADAATPGVALTSLVHPEDADALRADLALLVSDELARIEVEVRCHHPDGHVMWLLLSGSAVPSADGAPRQAVIHVLDIGERKRFEGRLQHLADHDPLTGLFNRRRFEQELTRAIAFVERYATPSAVFLIDLDGFKAVNDTLGHSYGDEILTRVATALRATMRETDVVARLGGDEFAVIVNSVGPAEADLVAQKVLAAIRQHGVVVAEQRRAAVSGSIGVALLDGESRLDGEALLARADAAMYAAKQEGRDRIAFSAAGAEPGVVTTQQSWLARLRDAIDQDRFELFAQPIRGICTATDDSYELLLRMREADGELIGPASFLYNAERFDLIQEIDRWVFGQALALLRASVAAGKDVCLSVNMSARTLGDATLLEDLGAMLVACPIPRDRLIVEVTETAAIVNIDRAREVARALRSLGIRFALDDFGAGFASFYYLKHLDFDFVKIDGEFIKGLAHNTTDQLVIRSVVDLARGLGARTIAEFVGDEDSVRRLEELGVDYGQGYHLGRPAPVAEILPVPAGAAP